jgi:excisionase family DNA binding protein
MLMSSRQREPLLTVAEAAAFWRVHLKTVYRWLSEGRVTYISVGTDKRIPESIVLKGVPPLKKVEPD